MKPCEHPFGSSNMAEDIKDEKESHMEGDSDEKKTEGTNDSPNQETAMTLEILPLVKEAQQQHGLRHGDYQRYRQYCARRLRRLYKTLHFQHGSRHNYKPKKLNEDLVTDVKFLHIPLMDAERAWSYAMELKLLANTEPRKRFHLVRRLRKAAHYAGELETLCQSEKCDARTKLEAQAYSSYMKGSVSFELQEWKEALELFGRAKTIYEKLAGAFSEEQRGMYLQRAEEITPNIRYCAYNLDEGETDISELMDLRMHTTGGAQDLLGSKIDEVLAQTREKEAATLTEVRWCGRTVPVKSEKVRAFILRAQQSAREMIHADSLDSKMALYENLLMECKDALQAIKDELKSDTGSAKTRSQKTESHVANLQFLLAYLSYIHLSQTLERNLLIADSMKVNLPERLREACETLSDTDQTSIGKKTSKPDDLVRIHDIILQNLSDMSELPHLEEDFKIRKEIAAQILMYKAYRCFYIAHSYLLAKKWQEAGALYDRVISYTTSAATHFQECDSFSVHVGHEQQIGKVQELASLARGYKCSAHASCILEGESLSDHLNELSLEDKSLKDRLDVYHHDSSLTSKKPKVTAFPPDFQPVPCKPLFFDLALNHVEFPSLAERVEPKKAGGITGYFKGWLWGTGS